MSTNAQENAPAQTSAPTTSGGPNTSSSSRGEIKRSLAGQSLDVQLATLAPAQRSSDAAAAAPRAAAVEEASTPVQRRVSRVGVVQRTGGTPPASGPVRTAETPTNTEVPNGAAAVANANGSATAPPPRVAWRKVVDKGRVAWYVVLEPVPAPTADGTPPAPSGSTDFATDIHPDQAFSLAANPAAEASADTFEQAVGNHAMGDPGTIAAASALGNKAVSMAEAYLAGMEKAGATQAQMDMSFQRLLGGMGPSWAGSAAVAIPEDATNKAALARANVDRIRAVAASGNVRELVNLAVSFIYAFSKAVVADMAAKTIELDTFYAEAKTRVGKLDAGVTDLTTTIAANIESQKGKADKDKWVSVVNDNSTVSGAQGTSRTKSNLPEGSDTSTRTVGSLGEYAQLSENEKLVMFGPEASKEKGLKDEHLTWSEGRKVWFINEADKFVQQCRDASVPLGGGVSGTTGRIMETSLVFNTGVSAVNMRAAAIGYLLPIRAHTLIEVMKGAEPFGGGTVPSPPSYAIYANIAPWGDLSSLHPNPAFTKLVQQTQKKAV